MHERKVKVEFHSPLANLMAGFLREKQACGYLYERESYELLRLDRFLCGTGLKDAGLNRDIVDEWTAKQANEKPGTQKLRVIRIRQFALFLRQQGIEAFVPEARRTPVNRGEFTPYIFRREEIEKILQAVDRMSPDTRAPMRHLIMPEIFRLLYCCGMRVSEVLQLKVADVDLGSGVLTVREGKFNKDRLVPMAPSITMRLRRYASILGISSGVFFPAPDGGAYSKVTVYNIFRQLLLACRIPHEGRGRGPRLHDLRHSHAVHKLESWYRQGADLGAKLPLLSTYMGHKSLVGTQRYLRLTPEIFPDITDRLDQFAGHIIPRRAER
jgi:integrase/recombinase XerD